MCGWVAGSNGNTANLSPAEAGARLGSNKMLLSSLSLFTNWWQGWAIPGFGQLYYTNTILEETITILYNTYTNTIPIFSEGLFMHTCILNGTKPCITEMEIKNVPFKTQPELMFKRYADLNNIHDFTCLIL